MKRMEPKRASNPKLNCSGWSGSSTTLLNSTQKTWVSLSTERKKGEDEEDDEEEEEEE